ncbi:DUF2057 domain-containing protein [Enterovibrio sp. ZSDZ42]|uniref:DUF2057 domain-containing protein n=1 Tax=Enterovibrio gelatinilyticus TaxID=2899819 RepID=A0ABT5QY94_9GAMM|nr:DUF2057 domain-containing protein [Enterovibrio sp. ZSDZ42]MDD1792994.1 DUF2057 domain-containing protein [Enterovibrio sp. ZSDZ42]
MKLLFIGLLALSGVVNAAEITAKNGVEFLVVDGKDVKKISSDADKRLELSPGRHQLVARYDDEVKRGSKNVIFTSKPYVFDLDVTNENVVLNVPKFRFESQAIAFFRNPEWVLENVSTGKTTFISSTLMTGSGFGAFNNMEQVVADYNRQNGIIIEGGEAKDLEEVLVSVDKKGNVDIKGDTVTQLKLWYTKATNEEKKAFKRWMIEQDF